MTVILLHNPVRSSRRLERVHMFPGRHLGEEEFDRQQDYADARLATLLRRTQPGIVHGLDIRLGPQGLAGDGLTVNPGLAVSASGQALALFMPLRVPWSFLIDGFLKRLQAAKQPADASGVFYLLLNRSARKSDNPGVDPCQRAEFDPSRDAQWLTAGSLELYRTTYAVAGHPDRIANRAAAEQVEAGFLRKLPDAVPLALLAVVPDAGGYRVAWLSTEAGRYEALPHSGYRVLLNQVAATLRRVTQAAASEANQHTPLADYLAANLNLGYLPAAGQLPLNWLQNPASKTPSLLWLPKHLGIDMVPVPEEAVLDLIQRHLPRKAIDLQQPAGDKIRLLLAVNEPDYRGDLLDIPPTDTDLEADVYGFHRAAQTAWMAWRRQFDVLYFDDLPNAVLNDAERRYLGMPAPEPRPALPGAVYSALIANAAAIVKDGDGSRYPYDRTAPEYPGYQAGIPNPPVDYTAWLATKPLDYAPPAENGLIVRYAVAQVELEALQNQVRAIRSRMEKTRDFLLLQRQQLDTQTVALAALAGGVAGDGTGLKVARWLPYASLDTSAPPETSVPSPATPAPAVPVVPAAPAVAATVASAPALAAANTSSVFTGFTAAKSFNFSTSLLSSSLASNAAQMLKRPVSLSAFELGINNSRLDLLQQVGREAVSAPAFQAKEYRFGVIDHISPEVNEYARAYYGMKDLMATLPSLFDPTDAALLKKQMGAIGRPTVADEPVPQADLRKLQTDLLALLAAGNTTALGKKLKTLVRPEPATPPGTISPLESAVLEAPAELDRAAIRKANGTDETDPKRIALLRTQYRYHGLFKAGRILTQWIAIFETRYNDLERRLESKLRELSAKQAELDKLAGLIRMARETLESLDRVRVERLGDYGVAQRLLEENWRKVFQRNQDRTRILTRGLRGLYYVRVRAAPVSAPLADPLRLRYGSSRDLVPGCDFDEDARLPAALASFFAAVAEIPMADWAVLKPLAAKLPPSHTFEFLERLRQSRFQARPATSPAAGSDTLEARLRTVRLQTLAVLQRFAGASLPVAGTSSLRTQAEAARVLSLEDLASGAAGALRKEAQTLREQLEHCQSCLLENLAKLPGSLRLQWGQLAEDDQIRVDSVAWWPGLENAEHEDFNATRSVAELVAWWFRQLDPAADANSLAAMRNMVRAALIHASLGDPSEIVSGMVHVPPRLAAVGESLQVKLNQAPDPGTRLQLLDAAQKLVAVLAVEDHGPQSTQVRIVDLVQPGIRISTRFAVVASKLNAKL